VNSRNNRWLCDAPSEVPIVMKTKFPATVMVLGVVSNKGDMMPPNVFEPGLRVNIDVYIDVLTKWSSPGWTGSLLRGPTSGSRTGGYGSTDLRLYTSTKLKMVNYWFYSLMHKKRNLYLNDIKKLYFAKIYF
jgi:hypothetical protein